MGWELLNADEAVDITKWPNYNTVHEILPIGSYYKDATNLNSKR